MILLILFYSSQIMRSLRKGFLAPQVLILMHSLWVFLSLSANHGVGQSIETAGVHFVETVAPFYLAVIYATDIKKCLYAIKLLLLLVVGMLTITIPESIFGFNWFKKIFSLAFSFPVHSIDKRLGLNRAMGTFDHPILMGVVASSVLGFAYFLFGKMRAGLVGTSSFLSLSSGAIASVSVQIGLLMWNKIAKNMKRKWLVLFIIFLSVVLFIEFLSNRSALKVFLSYVTFSAHTAYWRLLIWEFGIQNVYQSPFFGLGLNDWVRPSWMYSGSVDNFWLVNMMRYGVPSFLFYASSIIIISYKLFRIKVSDDVANKIRRGWLVGMFAMIISASTVHLWNNAYVYFNLYVGMGFAILNICIRLNKLRNGKIS